MNAFKHFHHQKRSSNTHILFWLLFFFFSFSSLCVFGEGNWHISFLSWNENQMSLSARVRVYLCICANEWWVFVGAFMFCSKLIIVFTIRLGDKQWCFAQHLLVIQAQIIKLLLVTLYRARVYYIYVSHSIRSMVNGNNIYCVCVHAYKKYLYMFLFFHMSVSYFWRWLLIHWIKYKQNISHRVCIDNCFRKSMLSLPI